MIKAIFKLGGFAATGILLLLPCLRGFYLLHHDADRSLQEAREFVLAVSDEIDAYAEDHGDQYPTDLNALPSAARAREGVGISNVWGGLLRAPLSMAPSNFRQVRKGALLDPWGVPWILRVDSNHETLRLESLGPDRKVGGGGDDADLVLTKRDGQTAISFLGEAPLW